MTVTDSLGEDIKKFYPTHKPGIKVTNPPYKPSTGKTGINKAWAESTDPEGDDICYVFEWDDGSTTKVPSSGFDSSGFHAEITRESSSFKVFAVDENGAQGTSAQVSKTKTTDNSNPVRLILQRLFDDFPLLKLIFSLFLP